MECGSANEDLGIAGPAEPLVALRAIGGHIEEVSSQSPPDVFVQAVDGGIRTPEPSGRPHVSVHDERREQILAGLFGQALDLDVAEPVEREARSPFLQIASATGINIRGPGGAEIGTVRSSVILQHLREAEGDCLSASAPDAQLADPGEVLAEIEDILTGLGLGDLLRQEGLGHAGRFVDLGLEDAGIRGKDIGPPPSGRVSRSRAPIPDFAARIVVFPLVEIR